MSDPYLPALDDLVFTKEELAAIDSALATDDPWDAESAEIVSAKQKIRAHHLARHDNTCCYCRTILYGGGHFMIDREHVLPKKKYKNFTFAVWNLSTSCKRCNMQFKGENDDFVIDKQSGAEFKTADNYRIVHPNYDKWEHHLDRLAVQLNTSVMVKYTIIKDSEKGRYMQDFFALQDLETNSFDEGQGVERKGEESDAVLAARALAKEYGQ